MSTIGWIAGGLVGLLAVAAVTSGSSGGAAGPVATTKDRFEIKPNLISASAALPLSAFSPGDVLSVVLIDNVKKIEIPVVVTVQTVGLDGLQTVFKNVTGSADLPIDGFHFAVFPRDVLLRVPAIGGGTLVNHTLDATDVAMGPNPFATAYGFGASGDAVKEMILANPPVGSTGFTDTPATLADIGKPGFYTTSGAGTGIPVNGIISPWAVGVNVNVRRVPSIPILLVAGEASPGYGERGFGGRGYGGESRASVGYGDSLIPISRKATVAPVGYGPPLPMPPGGTIVFNPAKAPDPKKAHAICVQISNIVRDVISISPGIDYHGLSSFSSYPGAADMLRTLQVFSGITPDGKYGPQTQSAFNYFISHDTRPDGSSGPLYTPAPRTGLAIAGEASVGKDFGGVAVVDTRDDYTRGYNLGVNAANQARASSTGEYSETITGLADLHKGFVVGVEANGGHTNAPVPASVSVDLVNVGPLPPRTIVNARGQRIAQADSGAVPVRFIPAPWTTTYLVTLVPKLLFGKDLFTQNVANPWGRKSTRVAGEQASVGATGSFGRQVGPDSLQIVEGIALTEDYANGYKLGQEDVRRVRTGATVYMAPFITTAGPQYLAGYKNGVAAAGGMFLEPDPSGRVKVGIAAITPAVTASLTAGSVKYQPSAYTWGRRPVRAF